MEEKVKRFEEFLNETLRNDLKRVLTKRDKVYQDIANFVQLKKVIDELQRNKLTDKPLKTQVDLGANFYCQAKVPDPSKICVNIGLDVYIEMSLDEAVNFTEKKIAVLEKQAAQLSEDATKVKAHIKLVLEGLRELQNIGDQEVAQHRAIW